MSYNFRNILYAADLDDGCTQVLAHAIDLANRLGARLHVLTALPDLREKSLIEIDTHVPQEALDKYHDDRARRAKLHLEEQIAAFYAVRAAEAPARPITEVSVQEGDDIGRLILDKAGSISADLILMGSHREGALAALLFGSVVHDVMRKTRIPLLLVPVTGEADDGREP